MHDYQIESAFQRYQELFFEKQFESESEWIAHQRQKYEEKSSYANDVYIDLIEEPMGRFDE